MAKMIHVEQLEQAFCNYVLGDIQDGVRWNMNVPIVEAEPVEYAHWETDTLDKVYNMEGHCSACHFSVPDIRYNYCPRCGRKMSEPEKIKCPDCAYWYETKVKHTDGTPAHDCAHDIIEWADENDGCFYGRKKDN